MKIRKEIIRTAIAGILVGAIDFGLYYLLINFLSFSLSKAISFTCAGIVAYVFNKHWIFQYDRSASYPEMGRYWIVNFLGLGINVLVNQSVLNMQPGSILLALVISSAVTGLLTFVCFKWWVFKVLVK